MLIVLFVVAAAVVFSFVQPENAFLFLPSSVSGRNSSGILLLAVDITLGHALLPSSMTFAACSSVHLFPSKCSYDCSMRKLRTWMVLSGV